MCDAMILIYVTVPDREVAVRVGTALVEERLAACVNILEGMESMYWWEGQVQRERECVLIAKSTAERYASLEKKVVELHPYECPCIIALPISRGYTPFLSWVRAQVHQASRATNNV